MQLILLRHGETEEEKAGIILGHHPGILSMKGKEHAMKTAEVIKKMNLRPEVIIASDLARAVDYAAIIGRELGLEIQLEPLLRERSAGEAEGKSQDEIDWEEYEKMPKLLRKHTGGESFEDVSNRAKEFLEKIKALPYRTAIIVSHSVFLAMLAVEINDLPLEEAFNYDFRNPLVFSLKKIARVAFATRAVSTRLGRERFVHLERRLP